VPAGNDRKSAVTPFTQPSFRDLTMMTKPHEPALERLGWRIRERRRDLRLSQGELGRRVGMDAHQIGRIERGLRDPSVLLLSRLAAALHCDSAAGLLLPPAAGDRPAAQGFFPPPTGVSDNPAADARQEAAGPEPPSPHHSGESLADAVRKFRVDHRLSQHRLGELCGVAQSTVFRWESGEPPSGSAAIILRQLLDRNPSSLVVVPLTATEERLLNELMERGPFTTRRESLAWALTELIVKGR
jgi:transcriptional regulator with XRE-family HTH domain